MSARTLLGSALLALVPAVGLAAPDLCVPRDGITFDGDRVRVVVRNLGEEAAPPTDLLLADGDAFSRLKDRSLDVRLAFLKELIQQIDPEWDSFVKKFLHS